MSQRGLTFGRRSILRSLAWLAVGSPSFADQLRASPRLTEGPFYPDKLPLDRDNDLIIVNNSLTPAVGQITHLTGRVLSTAGTPLAGATIEIWQCDAKAVYLHSADSEKRAAGKRDTNFQGYGRFETSSKGEYRFRTIKPVPYPGRPAPHIHVKVKQGERELLTTQIFVRGHEGNLRDGVYKQIRDESDRELVLADFNPLKDPTAGEFAAVFDLVIGRTPADRRLDDDRPRRKR